jgi:hypothetical protein
VADAAREFDSVEGMVRAGNVIMATYKLGPASGKGQMPKPTFRRPVICEQCAEALGNVDSVAEFSGMSANLVCAMWPEMRPAVRRHEEDCPSTKKP